jgi:hypothetical protein
VRWAAAPVAVSRLGRDDGVEEAGGRRPGARRPYSAASGVPSRPGARGARPGAGSTARTPMMSASYGFI